MRRALPRVRLSTMAALVALGAVAIWGGISWLSPTRRVALQLRGGAPAYQRRDAMWGLANVPPWEAGEAIGVLAGALRDPSPRVREIALSVLGVHGPRAAAALPDILPLAGDDDRGVRFTACAVLGIVATPGGPDQGRVVAALEGALDDGDPLVRLAAALSLLDLGEPAAAGPALALLATEPADEYLRHQARQLTRRHGRDADLLAGLIPLVAADDAARRRRALELIVEMAPPATARSALRAALRNGDGPTRAWAAERLDALAPGPAEEPEEPEPR